MSLRSVRPMRQDEKAAACFSVHIDRRDLRPSGTWVVVGDLSSWH